jgi:hypothetical protein
MTVPVTAAVLGRAAKLPGSSAFPFLVPFGRKPAPGCCGGVGRGPDLRAAAETIASMPPDRLVAFKSLLGVGSIRVYVIRAARRVALDL